MWSPDADTLERANLTRWMRDLGFDDYRQLHRWSVENREDFWRKAIAELSISFRTPPSAILDNTAGPTAARWLPDAKLNIVESCFSADDEDTALIFRRPGEELQRLSYRELYQQTCRVAQGLDSAGFAPGEAIAVVLPMTAESVAIYLGIIAAGCVAVSIADSFAPPQIASRLKIAGARGVFTYDHMRRGGKRIDLYARVVESDAPRTIVLPASRGCDPDVELRSGDLAWSKFLGPDQDNSNDDDDSGGGTFSPHIAAADDAINILFSSGTTGDPKAIPWSHSTPIKCATDGLLHYDLHAGDVVAWPTNLGWMMGPWLIFASLMNRATIALFEDTPTSVEFGRFVQDARVTMLGVVPTLVSAWRTSGCMEEFDWTAIRAFSSTGEASNPDHMLYLSSLAGVRPIIEYCGGTEIGGGYITSTVVEPNAPATFTTPAMGLDFVILDEAGQRADEGELFLVPPSIGLSDRLLNRDHHATYYEGVPDDNARPLRRHGDHFRRQPDGTYTAGGRVDDTMNLGGIKISSAEIEKVLNQLPEIRETAAVAVPAENQGPDQLIVFAVSETESAANTEKDLLTAMNSQVKKRLNPLFKVHKLVMIEALPRTASNKVMRRKLRDRLLAERQS